jgi:hypothetical protein
LLEEKEYHIFNLDSIYLVMARISFPNVDYLIRNKYSFGELRLKMEEENEIMKNNRVLA